MLLLWQTLSFASTSATSKVGKREAKVRAAADRDQCRSRSATAQLSGPPGAIASVRQVLQQAVCERRGQLRLPPADWTGSSRRAAGARLLIQGQMRIWDEARRVLEGDAPAMSALPPATPTVTTTHQ